ncbi:MAG: hypothetical protein IH944_14460 [Armatimonadetes bacterium]|nr:hypothetical protein [Armatimonadota bacterium]
MTESLSRLINQPIDYAGLFPPASLDMRSAIEAYRSVTESDSAWIVNRFVIAGSQLADGAAIWSEMREETDDRVPATVVCKSLTTGATALESLENEQRLIRDQVGCFDFSAMEIRLPLGDEFAGCAGALRKSYKWFAEREIDVYVELSWGEDMNEAMAELASTIDGVGFKARLGGVKKEQFPSVDQVAAFISEVAGLEAPFKFTAGLHEPVRYYDKELDCYHHGFINVFVASALAMIQHATPAEVRQILEIEDGIQFRFTDQAVESPAGSLSLKDIDEWWLYFGGYGSCTYEEPIEGLKKLGLI